MKYYLNNREVEIWEIQVNNDGSKFICSAYYVDDFLKKLTDSELDDLTEIYEDSEDLNGMWG